MKNIILLLSVSMLCILLLSCSSDKKDFKSYSIGSSIKNYPELTATNAVDTVGTVYTTSDCLTGFCKKQENFKVFADEDGAIVRKCIWTEELKKRNTLKQYTKWSHELLDLYGKEAKRTIIVDNDVETNTNGFGIKIMDYFLNGSNFTYIIEGSTDSATLVITKTDDNPKTYSLELTIDDNRYYTE